MTYKYILALVLLALTACDAIKIICPPAKVEPWRGGWYVRYSDPRAQSGEHLGMMLRDLGQFRDKDISQEWLTGLSERLYGMPDNSVILRFYYDGGGGNDASFDQVIRHIEQLKPLIQGYAHKIYVLQSGFIGAWGEWHTSQSGLLEGDKAERIFDALASAHDGWLQVRTAKLRQRLLPHWKSPLSERTGVHNDCLGRSRTDSGSWPRPVDHWKAAPSLFRGGETCAVSEWSTCEALLPVLKKRRYRYLNLNYHQQVIQGFRDGGCFEEITAGLEGGWK